MTAVVGILCSNGAVVGTDSSVTMGDGMRFPTIELPIEKLAVIEGHTIVAGTGSIGLDQRFKNVVRKALRERLFAARLGGVDDRTEVDACRDLSRATLQDFQVTGAHNTNEYGTILATVFENRPILSEFAVKGFQPNLFREDMWFGSMGSSQPITDPFLAFLCRTLWPTGRPTISQAVLAAIWALDHAIEVNPGGVNGPVRVAVLEPATKLAKGGKGKQSTVRARTLSAADVEEHRNGINAAKKALAGSLQDVESAPEIPQLKGA